MPITRPILYVGAAPGANSNTYTLFNSATTPALKGKMQRLGLGYYQLALANSHFGVINGYGSPDLGVTWHQFVSRRLPPNAPLTLQRFSERTDLYADVKFEWVNGGTAQSPWYVSQVLSSDPPDADPGYGNSTYIVAQSMAHSVVFRGPAIQVGENGELEMAIQWAATGTPVGTLALQFLKDGTNWRNVPDAELAFPTQVVGVAGDIVCGWSGLRTYGQVALLYTSASGGAANATLAAQFSTR